MRSLKKYKDKDIKRVFDDIIKNNIGKVIYIDCWATYCGPCLNEFPKSNKLMVDMKDDNIEFIFLCMDSDEKKWKSVLSKYNLDGQHYLLDSNQSIELRKVLKISSVPHYILIDKSGIIAERGLHLRPTNRKNIQKIVALL
jgi:thiol-disulfide isomerase/thioredoxin